MPDAKYFRPKDWGKFQHYRDRQPPWIKLPRSLLRDHDFKTNLTDLQQWHCVQLWLLYADVGRPLPWDCGWIAAQLQANPTTIGKTLQALHSLDYIELVKKTASERLAVRKQGASPETETETETERLSSKPASTTGSDASRKVDPPSRPNSESLPSKTKIAKDMASIWNETVGLDGLPKVSKMTDGRITACYARFRKELEGLLRNWQELCFRIRTSDFLMGRAERGAGHQNFTVTFDWVLKPANMVKIMEGNYDNRAVVKSPMDIDDVMGQ